MKICWRLLTSLTYCRIVLCLRMIIRQSGKLSGKNAQGAAVPEIGTPEQYIRVLDHNGYFEVTQLSEDDRKRNEMYKG